MKTIFLALLTFICSATFIYLTTIIGDWNHKRRLQDKFDWIRLYQDKYDTISYKNKSFIVKVEKGDLLNTYSIMDVDYYNVYINDILVISMNVVITCGTSYRFVKYPSNYESTEVEKIISKAAKTFRKKTYKDLTSKTKSFF